MMRNTVHALLFLLLTAICPGDMVLAQDKGHADLLQDLVKVEDETFIIDKHLRCQLSLPLSLGGGAPFNTFGMHVHFRAPAEGLISRDQFVALAMRIFPEVKLKMTADIPGLTDEQTLQAMKCREMATPGKQVKYVLRVNMVQEGVKSTIIDESLGTQHVTKEPWSVVLRTLPRDN